MNHRQQITVQDAIDIVAAAAPAQASERVPLLHALGRTLASDLSSRGDHPTVDNSALDGYACRFADSAGAGPGSPVQLTIIGEVPAGRPFAGHLGRMQAVRIFTGGALPKGADAIVRVEATREHDGSVLIEEPGDRGAIRRRSQDLRAGIQYLSGGRRLDAGALGLCAAMGHAEISVATRPRLALLTTGDEVIEPGGELGPGQVFDANSTSVAALAVAAGADVTVLPRVGDSVDGLASALDEAGRVDLLVTSGGVSMGNYDIVRDLLFERGRVLFWKVSMKPGGPALFGRWHDLPVLGLPGNPVSSMVVFLLLGVPFVAASLGRDGPVPYHDRVQATTRDPLAASGFKETFVRVRSNRTDDGIVVDSTGSQSSGILRSMAEADALAIVPPHAELAPGDPVEIIPLAPHYG